MTDKCMAKVVDCVASASDRRDEAGRMPTTRLIYDPSRPFEIGLELANTADQLVTWQLSRELLHLALFSGSSAPEGSGDVRVLVDAAEVRLELSSPSGHVVLWLLEAEVREFLLVTFHEVPLGDEVDHIDWAALIELMLEGQS